MYYCKRTIKLKKHQLKRYLSGQSSFEEIKQVSQWLDNPASKSEMEELFEKNWEENLIPEDQEVYHRILNIIHQKIEPRETSVKKDPTETGYLSLFTKVAASIIFIVGISFFILNQISSEIPIVAEIPPLKVYEKSAGIGQKLRVTLPDKTSVILNSNSMLKFDSDFGKTDRVVSLIGEAFFEITPDEARPFKVKTGEMVTTALGTAFNAFSRDGKVKIALTEGKVSVVKFTEEKTQEVLLLPGEMARGTFSAEENLSVKKFDLEKVTAWKEGKIHFQSKPLENILSDLQIWYGVSIEYDGKINKRRKVTGVFNNESLENILEGLTFSMGINYEIIGTKVILKP